MKLARKCREHAVALQEMAEVAPDVELEFQLRGIAQKWLNVAALRERLYAARSETGPDSAQRTRLAAGQF